MKHVLIVDDKEENLYMLKALLEGHQWKVTAAKHGAEALVKARQNPPDVVVSDLLMPVMDGYTLLRYWKADPRLVQVPFLVYTATYTEPADERLALNLGADGFIIKPIDPSVLLESIEKIRIQKKSGVGFQAKTPSADMEETGRLYSETLIRKLEEKSLQLIEANETLAREQEQLRLRDRAIMAVSQGILITDPNQIDNPIVFASPGFEQLTGYTAEEVLGKNCRFLQGPQTDPESVAVIRKAIAERESCQIELLNYRKDGKAFWNSFALSPVHDQKGKLTHFVGIQRDSTEKKSLEMQLQHSQKMDALGNFAGGIAHDFNNLLSIIGLHAEHLLTKIPKEGPVAQGIESILQTQEKGAELTRQLLAFSRKEPTALKPIDIDLTIQDLTDMLKRLIGENIDFETRLSPERKIMLGDKGQFEQVLINLVVNARDAVGASGKIRIETNLYTVKEAKFIGNKMASPGSYTKLSVIDSGAGMDEATLAHIFEPFFTTKEAGKGTGLGLPTVLTTIEASKGFIEVLSAPEKGASFHIYLPISTADLPNEVSPLGSTASKLVGQKTVLIAEDQEELRSILVNTLQRAGFTVMEAPNGKEALNIYKNHGKQVDLIVTDVIMPLMGGRELSENVLRINPKARFLFISGYTEDTPLKSGIGGVVTGFLDKPFTSRSLIEKVRSILSE